MTFHVRKISSDDYTAMFKEFDVLRDHRKSVRLQRQLGIPRCLSTKITTYFKQISCPQAILQTCESQYYLLVVNIGLYQTYLSSQRNLMSIKKQQYLSLGRQLVNVVQSIPFVDINRDDDIHLHPSDLRILIASILNKKICSLLVPA